MLRLAARADVLVENLRAGELERLGLGPEALHAVNPRLVIARISGYGQDGPYRDKPAFGAIGEAMGGIRHLTAHPAGSSRPAAAALRHLDQRRPGGAVCGDRAAVGAVAARRGGHRARARDRREPGGQRVQPDGGHAAGIRHGRPRAAAGGRGDRDRGADQYLSLRGREVAVHRGELRSDFRPADGGDRAAGAGARPAYATNG